MARDSGHAPWMFRDPPARSSELPPTKFRGYSGGKAAVVCSRQVKLSDRVEPASGCIDGRPIPFSNQNAVGFRCVDVAVGVSCLSVSVETTQRVDKPEAAVTPVVCGLPS
jgi:hypothetical protein